MTAYAWEFQPPRPSPEEVTLVEAFLNTIDEHTFGAHATKPAAARDLLADAGRLRDWLIERGLLDPAVQVSPRDVGRTQGLRTGLREWLRWRQGLSFERAAVRAARDLCREIGLRVDLDLDVGLAPMPDGVDGALAHIVGRLPVAEAAGTLARLKICAADDCRFVYYDHSRSRTSRWCSTDVCGNRIKTRRYRQQHAAS